MKKLIVGAIVLSLALVSCNSSKSTTGSKGGKWITLFDGSNLDAFKAYNKEELSDQWKIEGDVMVFTPREDRRHSENLITKQEFRNFKIAFDWKIAQGGNSGFMWAVQEKPEFHEPYATGPEIQILDDDGHPDGKNGRSHQSGALYDIIGASEKANPAGEWNHYEITINYDTNEGIIEMNGTQVVTFPVKGEEWDTLVKNSKFRNWGDFAKVETGHIALQDHGGQVSFKNIKIKEL